MYKISPPAFGVGTNFIHFVGVSEVATAAQVLAKPVSSRGWWRRGSEATERVRPWWEEPRQAQRA